MRNLFARKKERLSSYNFLYKGIKSGITKLKILLSNKELVDKGKNHWLSFWLLILFRIFWCSKDCLCRYLQIGWPRIVTSLTSMHPANGNICYIWTLYEMTVFDNLTNTIRMFLILDLTQKERKQSSRCLRIYVGLSHKWVKQWRQFEYGLYKAKKCSCLVGWGGAEPKSAHAGGDTEPKSAHARSGWEERGYWAKKCSRPEPPPFE